MVYLYQVVFDSLDRREKRPLLGLGRGSRHRPFPQAAKLFRVLSASLHDVISLDRYHRPWPG